MAVQLPVPFLTEADPDKVGEGSLDPLGMTSIADRLAEEIAPDVTARMSRIRFLTAIAAGATIAGGLVREVAADGRTPAYLAYEWIVVESMARRPPEDTGSIPGIQKARRVVGRTPSGHLDAGSYLQVPKVFGFHGVHKRLGRGINLIDSELLPLDLGADLLRAWESDQGLQGFAERVPRTPGGRLSRNLVTEVGKTLEAGRVTTKPGSHLWGHLAQALQPAGAGRRERKLLWEALVDREQPVRSELVEALRPLASENISEAQALRQVKAQASTDLKLRLAAIDAYERVAWLLNGALRAIQFISSNQGAQPVMPDQLASHVAIARASKELPGAIARAVECLSPVGQDDLFERNCEAFADHLAPPALADALLSRHELIQEEKGGKRPWLERSKDGGFVVRPPYRTTEDAVVEDGYVHPYRVGALSSFILDLRKDK